MARMLRVAAGQLGPIQLKDTRKDAVERLIVLMRQAAAEGARLVVFPELALTTFFPRWFMESQAEIDKYFEREMPGPDTLPLFNEAKRLGIGFYLGYAELTEEEGKAHRYNAAVLVAADGRIVGKYRKVHLPYLGVDMHTTPGDRPFAVHDVNGVKIGMNICYDVGFPEAARCLTLLGADLIVLPTNWPPGAECMASASIPSRAMENAVYYAAVNRVGTERGFRFIGRSSMCAPNGKVIAASEGVDEEILYADIDVEQSRRKHIIRVPDKHEIDRLADRRPEMYELLTRPHELKTPRQVHQH